MQVEPTRAVYLEKKGGVDSYTLPGGILGDLPPEEALCLLLARKTFKPAFPGEYCTSLVKAVQQRLGWKRVIELAFRVDIHPLLYKHLLRLQTGAVPDEVLWSLRTLVRYNEKRCVVIREELCRLLDFFQGYGFRALPLRGVALAQELYGEPELRPVRDIDLLLPREKAVQAVRLLEGLGYRLEVDEAFFERFILPSNCAIPMAKKSNNTSFVVDLHWDLALPSFGVSPLPPVFWEEGIEERPMFGKKRLNTRLEWTLLFLALHAFHHRFSQFKGLVDLNEVCLRKEMEWDTVEEIAGRYKWMGVVQLALTACQRLFGTEIPGTFRLNELPSWVALFPSHFGDYPLKGPKRFHYLIHLLFWPTQSEYQFLPLPEHIRFLYFFLRPLRGAIVAIRRVLTFGFKALNQKLTGVRGLSP